MKPTLLGRLSFLVVAAGLPLAIAACGDDGNIGNGCGDGTLNESLESCDDGNAQSGDGCSASCTLEHGWICGDGAVAGAEVCDPGRHPGYCTADCTTITGACGDGVVQPSEETCDGPRGCVSCADGRGFVCDASANTCVGMGLPAGMLLSQATGSSLEAFCAWMVRALDGEGAVHVCGSTQYTILSEASCRGQGFPASVLGACTVAELEDWGLASSPCSMLTSDPNCAR